MPASRSLSIQMLELVRFDAKPAHRQPSIPLTALATAVSILLCLVADWALATIAVAVFPTTKGYPHFAFADYSKLTVIGIVIAGIGWPIVTRFCSTPRWLFLRLALAVSVVLLLPDLYIWLQGQPGKAVAFLALMHIAIGVITYNVLVHIAPVGAAD